MSVVIAGSVALDNVKTPQDEQKNLLGGSASYAALAASVFVKPVHLVGIIGHDFPPQHLEMLNSHGVDISGLERSSGASFTWTGEYHEDMNNRTTHNVAVNVLENWSVNLPQAARRAKIAVAVAMVWLRPPLAAPLQEARRVLDAVGWAAILPQMLASLGAVFLAAGVGQQVGAIFAQYIPLDTRTVAVAAYCVGMALFTIIMGNAFAAFPVMTAAVGLPIVVHQFGGNAATVCAIGMLAGFCGTLMTPMAANFNVVPANLLDLPDRKSALNGVIRAQIPTALPLLIANIVLMRLLAFP